jgi:1-acyl-sn-glycerol-3-phosphate acyltransferase
MERALFELKRAMPEGHFIPHAVMTTKVRPSDWYRDTADRQDADRGVDQVSPRRPAQRGIESRKRSLMTFVRSLLYAIWFYVTMAVIGVLVCMPVSLFSRDAAMSAIRLWSGAQRLGLRILCGIKTEFRGMEHLPKGAGLIAMKHQSTYDTIAPFLFIQNPGYILKKELLKIPVFGIYASRVGIPIDRAGGTKTMKKMLADAKKGIATGPADHHLPGRNAPAPRHARRHQAGRHLHVQRPSRSRASPSPSTPACAGKARASCASPAGSSSKSCKPIEPGLKRAEFTQRLKDALDPATQRLVAEGRAAQK